MKLFNFFKEHLFIFLSLCFAVMSQLIIKWKMSKINISHLNTIFEKFLFAFSMLFNPFIMISIILSLLSGLSWMIAMTKFEISYAYPFTILGLIFVTIFSIIFFRETLNINKVIGIILICFGIFIISKGMK